MFRKAVSILILVYCHALSLNAQSVIEGVITDKTDRQSLQGAQVQLVAAGKTVLTDSNGYYKIDAVPQAHYQLTISRIGYFKTTHTIDAGKEKITLNIQSLDTKINDNTELHNQLYYSRYDFRFYSNPTYFMNDPVNGEGIKQYENRDLLGYIFDMVVQYTFKHWELGVSAENLLNVTWREGQFYDYSQLKGETEPVLDFHYTPERLSWSKGV